GHGDRLDAAGPRRPAAEPRATRAGTSEPGRGRDPSEAAGNAGGERPAAGRGAGVAGASGPAVPHARRLAAAGGIDRAGRSRSPWRDERERNGRTLVFGERGRDPCRALTSSGFAPW